MQKLLSSSYTASERSSSSILSKLLHLFLPDPAPSFPLIPSPTVFVPFQFIPAQYNVLSPYFPDFPMVKSTGRTPSFPYRHLHVPLPLPSPPSPIVLFTSYFRRGFMLRIHTSHTTNSSVSSILYYFYDTSPWQVLLHPSLRKRKHFTVRITISVGSWLEWMFLGLGALSLNNTSFNPPTLDISIRILYLYGNGASLLVKSRGDVDSSIKSEIF